MAPLDPVQPIVVEKGDMNGGLSLRTSRSRSARTRQRIGAGPRERITLRERGTKIRFLRDGRDIPKHKTKSVFGASARLTKEAAAMKKTAIVVAVVVFRGAAAAAAFRPDGFAQ